MAVNKVNEVKFPNRLREVRTRLGYSQESVAYLIDMSLRHYIRIENGEVEPGVSKLRRLARLFGLTMDELCR